MAARVGMKAVAAARHDLSGAREEPDGRAVAMGAVGPGGAEPVPTRRGRVAEGDIAGVDRQQNPDKRCPLHLRDPDAPKVVVQDLLVAGAVLAVAVGAVGPD